MDFLFAIISAREKHSSLLLSQFTVNVCGGSGSWFYLFRCCRCLSINALCEKSITSIARQSCRLFTIEELSLCLHLLLSTLYIKKKEKKLLSAGNLVFERQLPLRLVCLNVHHKFTHLCGIIPYVHVSSMRQSRCCWAQSGKRPLEGFTTESPLPMWPLGFQFKYEKDKLFLNICSNNVEVYGVILMVIWPFEKGMFHFWLTRTMWCFGLLACI